MNYFLAFCITIFVALQGGFAQNTKGDKPVWLPKSTPKGKTKPLRIRTPMFRSKASRPPVYSNSPRTPKADFARKQYPPVRNNARPQSSVRPIYENDDLVKEHYTKSQKLYKKNYQVVVITPAMKRVHALRQRSIGSLKGRNYPIGNGSVSSSKPFRGKVRPEVKWGKHHHVSTATTTDLAGSPLRRKNFMSPPWVSESRTTAKGRSSVRVSNLVKDYYIKSQKLYKKDRQVVAITPAMGRVHALRQRSIGGLKGRNYPIGNGSVSSSKPFRGKVRPEVKWGKHHHVSTAITTDLAGSPLRRKNFMSPPLAYEPKTTAKGNSSVKVSIASKTPQPMMSGAASQSNKAILGMKNLFGKLPSFGNPSVKAKPSTTASAFGHSKRERLSNSRNGLRIEKRSLSLASGTRNMRLTGIWQLKMEKAQRRISISGIPVGSSEGITKRAKVSGVLVPVGVAYEKKSGNKAGFREPTKGVQSGSRIHSIKLATGSLQSQVKSSAKRGVKGNYVRVSEPKMKYSTGGFIHRIAITSNAKVSLDCVRGTKNREALKEKSYGSIYDNNGSWFGNFFNHLFSRKIPGQKDKPEKLRYDKNERKLWKDLYE